VSVSPDYLVALHQQGMDREILRRLASTMSSLQIFNAVRRYEITPEEFALIRELQREAEPWPVRLARWLTNWWEGH